MSSSSLKRAPSLMHTTVHSHSHIHSYNTLIYIHTVTVSWILSDINVTAQNKDISDVISNVIFVKEIFCGALFESRKGK